MKKRDGHFCRKHPAWLPGRPVRSWLHLFYFLVSYFESSVNSRSVPLIPLHARPSPIPLDFPLVFNMITYTQPLNPEPWDSWTFEPINPWTFSRGSPWSTTSECAHPSPDRHHVALSGVKPSSGGCRISPCCRFVDCVVEWVSPWTPNISPGSRPHEPHPRLLQCWDIIINFKNSHVI